MLEEERESGLLAARMVVLEPEMVLAWRPRARRAEPEQAEQAQRQEQPGQGQLGQQGQQGLAWRRQRRRARPSSWARRCSQEPF